VNRIELAAAEQAHTEGRTVEPLGFVLADGPVLCAAVWVVATKAVEVVGANARDRLAEIVGLGGHAMEGAEYCAHSGGADSVERLIAARLG
jgi:hypothetical protein